MKEPKPPREKRPRQPLFGRKKKSEPEPGATISGTGAATAAPPTAMPVPGMVPPPAPSVPGMAPPPPIPGSPEAEAPQKKGLFHHKPQEPKAPRQKKEKQPREKKVKEPKSPREKKARAPREKRPRGPKAPREKKPKGKKPKDGGPGKSSPVGLDLGRTSMTAVQLKYRVGGATLLAAAIDRLPEGLIQEGEVRDIDALAFAIKDFWKTHRLKGKKIALGLANQKVVVRTLEFPKLEMDELKTAIQFQAQDYIPIPIEEAVFDFHVMDHFTDENGVEKLKVLVVAAQKQMVMDFVNAIKKANLSVHSIDLQAFAMLRSLAPKSMLDLGPAATAIAVANIASDITNLVVAVQGEPQFTRIISFGGDNFTRAVQEYRGVTFSEAEMLKAQAGLLPREERVPEKTAEGVQEGGEPTLIIPPGETGMERKFTGVPFTPPEQPGGPGSFPKPPAPEPPATQPPVPPAPGSVPEPEGRLLGGEDLEPGSPESLADVQRVLELAADSLADELRRSIDYYVSQETSAPITKLYISGGGALLNNLDRHFSQVFPYEVVLGDPLLRISQNRSNLKDEELKALGPQLAIAIGLALEDEE